MISLDTVQRLQPVELDYRRSQRWRGDSSSVSLNAFSSNARGSLLRLYEILNSLQTSFEKAGPSPATAHEILDEFIAQSRWRVLLRLARAVEPPPQSGVDPTIFDQVIHDIRGGALTQLIGVLQLSEQNEIGENEIAKSYLRIRDHTKILRNAVPELDLERYQRDLNEKLHHVDLLVEKWNGAQLLDNKQTVDIELYCDFSGPVSDRCVEFSALDRVLYNLMNNATGRTADGKVELFITTDHIDEADQNLLLAVVNSIEDDHARLLIEKFGGSDVSRLMDGGFTTGGKGIGMSICSEFVAFAYGVTPRETIDNGYVGARIIDDQFISWVHWPIVSET